MEGLDDWVDPIPPPGFAVCPCCRGRNKLLVFPADGDPVHFEPCCHCEDGFVPLDKRYLTKQEGRHGV